MARLLSFHCFWCCSCPADRCKHSVITCKRCKKQGRAVTCGRKCQRGVDRMLAKLKAECLARAEGREVRK